jgi:hypothetical protein
MSRGLGRVQRACLRVIEQYEAAGQRPTTLTITADVYRIKPDQNGKRRIGHAQHVSVKRALAVLQRKVLVLGQQHGVRADGLQAESCNLWSLVRG